MLACISMPCFPRAEVYCLVSTVRCLSPPPKFWQPPVRDRPTCGNGACCVKDVLQGDFAIVSRRLAQHAMWLRSFRNMYGLPE